MGYIFPFEVDRSFPGDAEADERAYEGGLPHTVAAKHRNDLPFVNREIHPLENMALPVIGVNMLYGQDRCLSHSTRLFEAEIDSLNLFIVLHFLGAALGYSFALVEHGYAVCQLQGHIHIMFYE